MQKPIVKRKIIPRMIPWTTSIVAGSVTWNHTDHSGMPRPSASRGFTLYRRMYSASAGVSGGRGGAFSQPKGSPRKGTWWRKTSTVRASIQALGPKSSCRSTV